MSKNIDIQNRVVDFYDVDTGQIESEIVDLLKRNMKVRFHSAKFNNRRYVFTGSPDSRTPNAITVTGFRKKSPGENVSVEIG